MTISKVGIGNRPVFDKKARTNINTPRIKVARGLREVAVAAQIASAWVLRERLTKKFSTDKWGVSPRA